MKKVFLFTAFFYICTSVFSQNSEVDDYISNELFTDNIKIVLVDEAKDQYRYNLRIWRIAVDTIKNQLVYITDSEIVFNKSATNTSLYFNDNKLIKVIMAFYTGEGIFETVSYWKYDKIDPSFGPYLDGLPINEYYTGDNIITGEKALIHSNFNFYHDEKHVMDAQGLIEHCKQSNLRIDKCIEKEILKAQ